MLLSKNIKNGHIYYEKLVVFVKNTVISTLKWLIFNEKWSFLTKETVIFPVHDQNFG